MPSFVLKGTNYQYQAYGSWFEFFYFLHYSYPNKTNYRVPNLGTSATTFFTPVPQLLDSEDLQTYTSPCRLWAPSEAGPTPQGVDDPLNLGETSNCLLIITAEPSMCPILILCANGTTHKS